MICELWDTETGNLVESFGDDGEALRVAGELIALNPGVYPAVLTLLSVDERGELGTVASGDALGVLAGAPMRAEERRAR